MINKILMTFNSTAYPGRPVYAVLWNNPLEFQLNS